MQLRYYKNGTKIVKDKAKTDRHSLKNDYHFQSFYNQNIFS